MIVVSRNPYDRVEVVRDVVRPGDRTGCRWCGRCGRFRYGAACDDGRVDWQVGTFCSVGCFRSYTMQ